LKTLSPPYSRRQSSAVSKGPTADVRRVLHLRTVTGRGGGPEKTILNSPRYIGPGYDMRLVYFRPADDSKFDLFERAKRMGVSLIDIPENGPFDFRALRRLAAEIREFKPHILHPHDYKTNILGLFFGRLCGIPIVTTLHGYGVRSPRLSLYYQFDRFCLRWLNHVIVVSEEIERLVRSWGVPAPRCTVVHNAIDSDAYRRRESANEAKVRLNLPTCRFVVGAVGRLSPEKAFDHLIAAVDQLCAAGHDLELLIVGDGPERARLERCAAAAAHSTRIHLLGHRTDIVALMSAFNVFVLPSRSEGLPNALLEAMALEVPVVATAVGGIPRVITHETDGLLIDSSSSDAIAAGIRRLADDTALARRLARAGRDKVVEHFSFRRRMEKIRGIYDRVLADYKRSS
jgi:glycosyltransferase involved in cell wall biosynthesis